MSVKVAGIEFSDEEIQAIKQASGSAPVEDVEPSNHWGTAPRIGAVEKVTVPNVRDGSGTPLNQQKVTRPSPDRFNDQAMARRQLELEEEKERLAQIAQLDPQSLHNSLQALDRQVRSLKKEIANLKKEKG